MALKKQKQNFGYNFEYWMITSRSYAKEPNRTDFVISLYKDKESRDTDIYCAVESRQYFLEGDISTEGCYNYVKTLPEFEGAEDC